MERITKRVRRIISDADFLLIGGGCLLVVIALFGTQVLDIVTHVPAQAEVTAIPSTTPTPSPSASASVTSSARCGSAVHYYASSPDKQTSYDFGPAFTQDDGEWTKSSILSQLNVRLCKGDPALTSAIYTYAFSGRNPDYTVLDATTAEYTDNRDDWKADVATVMKGLRDADFSTTTVPAGSWSLCMLDNGDGTYALIQCKTARGGTAAVFTTDHGRFTFRLDCGFQPVGPEKFPGVPQAPQPSSSSSSSTTPSSAPSSTPSSTPKTVSSPKNTAADPSRKGHAPTGGGTNADPGSGQYVPSSDAPQPPSTPRTNPPAPPASTSTTSSSPSSTPSPTRSVPAPEQSAPSPSDAPSTCVPPPGKTTC